MTIFYVSVTAWVFYRSDLINLRTTFWVNTMRCRKNVCPREMFLTLFWFSDTRFSHFNISEIRMCLAINNKPLCHSLISSVLSSGWYVIELCVLLWWNIVDYVHGLYNWSPQSAEDDIHSLCFQSCFLGMEVMSQPISMGVVWGQAVFSPQTFQQPQPSSPSLGGPDMGDRWAPRT